jgi:hypothetical protein
MALPLRSVLVHVLVKDSHMGSLSRAEGSDYMFVSLLVYGPRSLNDVRTQATSSYL